MGLSREEFDRLTPRQFYILLDRHRERVEHEEWLAGMIGAAVRNSGMRHAEKWLLPHDMVPSLPIPQQKRKRTNRQAVADQVRAMTAEHNKRVATPTPS